METTNNPAEIDVHCSPRSYQRIKNNPHYLDKVREYILSANEEYFVPLCDGAVNEVIVQQDATSQNDLNNTETCDGTDYELPPSSAEQCEEKQVWLDAQTKLLLSLVKEVRCKVGKTVKFKSKRKMWTYIHGCFMEKGYKFSISQIENKYRAMERQFKKATCHNEKTGRNRVNIKYENELRDILEERPAIFPEHILGGKGTGARLSKDQLIGRTSPQPSTSRGSIQEPAARSSSPQPSCSRQRLPSGMNTDTDTEVSETNVSSGRVKRTNYKAEILQELILLREEKEKFHEETIKIHKERNKTLVRMEEQRKEKLEVLRDLKGILKN